MTAVFDYTLWCFVRFCLLFGIFDSEEVVNFYKKELFLPFFYSIKEIFL